MDVDDFLKEIIQGVNYRGQIVHIEDIPGYAPIFAEPNEKLSPSLKNILSEQGIERLYSHQASAINFVREGKSIIVVTSAASGKTLCYNI